MDARSDDRPWSLDATGDTITANVRWRDALGIAGGARRWLRRLDPVVSRTGLTIRVRLGRGPSVRIAPRPGILVRVALALGGTA